MYVTYTRIYGWSDYGGESSYQPGYRLENMMWMTLLVYDYIIPGEKYNYSIGNIYQSFAGQDIYPTLEEKAANLLYFITKNHSFSDGNKRIAATMFLYFLDKNGILFADGNKLIDDHTLVALTIMIAESKPDEKEMMISVIMNCICG